MDLSKEGEVCEVMEKLRDESLAEGRMVHFPAADVQPLYRKRPF